MASMDRPSGCFLALSDVKYQARGFGDFGAFRGLIHIFFASSLNIWDKKVFSTDIYTSVFLDQETRRSPSERAIQGWGLPSSPSHWSARSGAVVSPTSAFEGRRRQNPTGFTGQQQQRKSTAVACFSVGSSHSSLENPPQSAYLHAEIRR